MEDFKEKLTNYYNKFNEDKRLNSRHGQVEYITSMKYLHEYLKEGDKIIDIGAGTGRYSIILKEEGYDVTAIEYVKPNIGKLKAKDKNLKVIEANATNLNMIRDKEFDIAILFGPLYHLKEKNDRLKALLEAKRITKRYLFVTYIMNEYAIIKHAFIDNYYHELKDKIDNNFHTKDDDNIYFFMRLEEIDELNLKANLKLIKRFASDGPSDYIRKSLNEMDEETFNAFIDYHLKTCERKELLGASSHVVDILEIAS